jgi:hypothetical protein
MNSALTGKPFDEKSFANSLQGALINTGMAQGANEIGNAYTNQPSVLPALNDFTHKVAHAVLGCAAGAATAGNSSGCAPGAVGAVVGELTAEFAKKNGMSDAQALGLAKIIAATSGVIVGGGGDNAAAVNIAANTGANAAENNYLNHTERAKLSVLYRSCGADESCRAKVVNEFVNKSTDNDKALLVSCIQPASEACGAAMRESINYAADRDVDAYGMRGDRIRSAGVNFAQSYSLPNGQGTSYYNSRELRNDFYIAAQDAATAKGSDVVWPQMAADVTRFATLGVHDLGVGYISVDRNTIKLSQNINRAIFVDAFNAFGNELLFSSPLRVSRQTVLTGSW